MNLIGKIILVVGGAAGIGRATASLCNEAGATVIIADIDSKAGAETASALGLKFIQVNVSDEDSVKALFEQIKREHGRLDVLLQTAGILRGAYLPIEEFALETWHSVLDVNVTGSFLCAKYAVPLMKTAGKGVIVLVSSIAATNGSSSYAYGTSKGGVTSLGVTMARKLEEFNIRVNVLHPGNIDTSMKRSVIEREAEMAGQSLKARLADYSLGVPEGVGKVLAWLASDDADYVCGFISTR